MFRGITFIILLCSLALSSISQAATVKTGAERLAAENFQMLRGKRVALVTNQTAQVGGVHLIDLMVSAGAAPAVVFTPEHGLTGTAEDGVRVGDGTVSGIPVKSLYGAVKKPRPEDLKGVDVVLFDIQDIGVRFYTYISTMGLAMQAAAKAGIPFVVLDRPNPLGGDYVSGFVRKDLTASFTSLYPIPIAHGMTAGELAGMIKGEAMLPGLGNLKLTVVRMQGWQRWMRWPDTGLPFVGTSPNIADFNSCLLYPGTGLVESTAASEGRGTPQPFQLIGWPGIDADLLAAKLNGAGLPGLHFEPVRFIPRRIPGKDSCPKYKGREVTGVRIDITDYKTVTPVEAGVAVVEGLYSILSPRQRTLFFEGGFDDMAGSLQLRDGLKEGLQPKQINLLWNEGVASFLKKREHYLLYADPPQRQ